jgi:hypothetical protein
MWRRPQGAWLRETTKSSFTLYLEPFAYTSFLGISEALPFGFAQGREPVERHLDIFKQPP